MSEDRPDPRMRELTYQLMGMAPDAPPFPEEAAAMNVSKERPPMLVWAAAAAAVVLVVGLPLFLFRGGGTVPDDDVATTIAVPTSTAPPSTSEAPATTSAPAVTSPPASVFLPITTSGDCRQDWEGLGDRNADTWYVFFGCDRPGMEDVLVARPRAIKSADSREGDFEGLGAAMGAQLAGPTGAELAAGYSAFRVIDDGLSTPDGAFPSYSGPGDAEFNFADFRANPGMANASASAASTHLLAQLSSVAFQFPSVDTVTFAFGHDCDSFWNWLQRDCTQIERSDWENGELTAALADWWDGAGVPPTTTEPPVTTTTLPGEAFDIGPQAGDIVGVIGVAHDDVLNVREGPGAGYEIVTTLPPLTDDVVATGRHRFIPGAIWSEVTANGVIGWVSSRFLGHLGGVEDLTSLVVDRLGTIPEAETMVDLGRIVADSFKPDESGFRTEISVAPTVGDLGEVTYDVIGLADDAQLGWRLHIFGQPTEGGEGFSLKSVEGIAFCGRGVTAEGFCV